MVAAWITYSTLSAIDAVKRLETSLVNGLSASEAQKRHHLYGANDIPSEQRSWLLILVGQYTGLFTYILCAVVLFYAYTGSYAEALIIVLILLVNGLLGFFQEYRSDRALQLLQQYLAQVIGVIRDGKETTISVRQLVPGDRVIVRAGEVVPADLRIIELHHCLIDESIMTGESMPVEKSEQAVGQSPRTLLDAQSIAYMGTEVVRGMLVGLVIAIGKDTALGGIGLRARSTVRTSTFAQEMPHITWFIGVLLVGSLSVLVLFHIFAYGLLWSTITKMAILSITLVVSTIPEALPLVITCALSQGALRLAQNGAVIVKRLSALEDLGHMEILCSDKTGTLTEHILTVSEIISHDPQKTVLYARLAGAPYSLKQSSLHGFDYALAAKLGSEGMTLLSEYARTDEIPFDPTTKVTIVVVTRADQKYVITVGIPEELMKLSPSLSAEDYKNWLASAQSASQRGERVLGVAVRSYGMNGSVITDSSVPYDEFLGIVTFTDPIKKTAALAIQKARELNVMIKIISGDSVEVCAYVSRALGLIQADTEIITGEEWDKLSPEDQIQAAKKYTVFARAVPQQKADIVRALKTIAPVGYMGDGVNDTLPLREANVALVVQNAPTIVYESGDIILMHKSLLNVVNAIGSGRAIVHNILTYLRIILAASFSNFYSMSLAAFFFEFPPIFPLHMLIVNLLSDVPLIAIATDRVDSASLNRPQRFDRYGMLGSTVILAIVNSCFDAFFLLLFYKSSIGILETGWSLWSIISELAIIFSLRSTVRIWRAIRPSWQLIVFVMTAVIVAVMLPYTTFGHVTLSYSQLSAAQLARIGMLALCYVAASELLKPVILGFFRRTPIRSKTL